MSKKYYCKICKGNHLLNSDIGKKHRGIEVKKPRRKTFVINLPNGKIYKTTSIYNYKYAVLRLVDSGAWYIDLYVSKEKADHRVEWFKEPHQTEIVKVKLIKLDQKNIKG